MYMYTYIIMAHVTHPFSGLGGVGDSRLAPHPDLRGPPQHLHRRRGAPDSPHSLQLLQQEPDVI